MSETEGLSRRDKIGAIMTMVGAAPSDFDEIRGNFEDLSDETIDRTFRDCLAMQGYLKEWRDTRGPAVATDGEGTT